MRRYGSLLNINLSSIAPSTFACDHQNLFMHSHSAAGKVKMSESWAMGCMDVQAHVERMAYRYES